VQHERAHDAIADNRDVPVSLPMGWDERRMYFCFVGDEAVEVGFRCRLQEVGEADSRGFCDGLAIIRL
jgi:hypothetical protein